MAGRYEIALSPKGRVKLRQRFVSQNDRVFLTNHIVPSGPRCLLGFSPQYWQKFLEKFEGRRTRETRLLWTFYVGGAQELTIDKNGAIAIPPPLLKFAGLKQRVTLLEIETGVDRFELLDPNAHQAALVRVFDALVTMKS
jgi:DNA-binding transcriptional regulator/RsmH inhibitor MraZ